jgi:hypothetical protein
MSASKEYIKCRRCGKEMPWEKAYTHRGKLMCEDCALQAGLFPLGHTGQLKKSYYIKDRKR